MTAVASLKILAFRNLQEQTVDLDPGVNLILGQNGQGKTALLECVSVLADLRSFRTADLGSLLQHGASHLGVRAICGLSTLDFRLSRDHMARLKRSARHGDKLVRSTAEWFRKKTKAYEGTPCGFQVVTFHPGDMEWIVGGPQTRRNYLDRLVAVQDPNYLINLLNYNASLQHRNRLLKNWRDGSKLGELRVFTDQLIHYGAVIRFRRAQLIDRLLPRVQAILAEIAPTQRQIQGHIKTTSRWPENPENTRQNSLKSLDIQVGELAENFDRNSSAEIAAGVTLVGPHRDDFLLTVDGMLLKSIGSQGELKTVILAVKIAELNWVRECADVPVVVLLDDLSSELDATRRRVIMKRFADQGLQTLITATAFEEKLVPAGAAQFKAELGLFWKVN